MKDRREIKIKMAFERLEKKGELDLLLNELENIILSEPDEKKRKVYIEKIEKIKDLVREV